VPRFEGAVANYCGANHTFAVHSATAALHIACLALGLGADDYLWTVPTTFVASANCALYCGAKVDFVDIDPNTYNMSVACLEEKLKLAQKEGSLPKVVVPVHLCGQSCEMEHINALSKKYGFSIIEDAAHAIGGRYKNGQIGSCQFSDITIFSFHPVKIITTGEGGMITTNDPALAERIRRFRSHGITSNPALMHDRPDDEIWNYQQIDLGYNYRMTDILASLGISQLDRLETYIEKRHEIASCYDKELADMPIQLPFQHPDCFSSFHLYPIRLKQEKGCKNQREVYDALHAVGINVNLHYIPVYRQPYYQALGFESGYCPESECYFKEVLSIPIYPSLEREQQQYVIKSLKNILDT
jgi:UDP-4-amino-4,6-dideoxy-N-acetyl-beta-L-altrosamine transaminase